MQIKKLGELQRGMSAIITRVGSQEGALRKGEGSDLSSRLLEMGLLEGASVEVVHEAPFGKDPIAVRIRGAVIALRRTEANWVEVLVS
jgi:ferrous iron transport protein A